jgi:hypothetical protein
VACPGMATVPEMKSGAESRKDAGTIQFQIKTPMPPTGSPPRSASRNGRGCAI